MSLEYYSAWFVWAIPLLSSLFVPLIGRYSQKIRNYYAVAIAALTAALALSLVPSIWSGYGDALTYTISWLPSGITAGVYIDPLSVLFTCLVSFFGLIIIIYSLGYMKSEQGLSRYYFLFLLFIGSMIGLVLSDNLLQMFIFWEMVGLCSYALISFWYKKPESIHSGVKVFIMTRIGDVCLLAAIGLLFFMFGTFSFHGIVTGIAASAAAGTLEVGLLVTAAFLVLGAAVAKSAQFPLFTWLYSAMEAPTSVSALLHAATMVKAGVYLLSRFILIFSVAPILMTALQANWFPTIAWIGVITAFIGATLGLVTTDIKGVLAYSTVSQIGFMMAGLGTAVAGAASVGWFASLFHTVSHGFFEGLGFLLAGGIIHAMGTRDMRLMGGLRKAMPVTFVLALIMVLTASGLPPFAAFFSKGLILESVAEIGSTAGLIQLVLLYATAAITFAYCIRMFSLVFMGKLPQRIEKSPIHETYKIMLLPAAVLAVFCIVWGLSEPIVAAFMHVDLEISLAEAFTTLEFPLFMGLLLPIFILAYWSYYRGFMGIRNVAAGKNPLAKLLSHSFFIDDFYYGVAIGVKKLSVGFLRVDIVLNQFSMFVGKGVEVLSGGFMRLDGLLTRLMSFLGDLFVRVSLMLNRIPLKTFQNYIVALMLGVILMVVILILTGAV
ncbi:MAG TPA: proton-conducting transporter membrane subunit [Candidatus Acidoferrales bacterium]|nr:proton-conducting transporter membrane subunit [Candidatus Acidoferrales bacterium]